MPYNKTRTQIFIMRKTTILVALVALMQSCTSNLPDKGEVLSVINQVNTYWQTNNSPETRPFWDNAAYHTGNMEVYFLTGNEEQLAYTKRWAEYNKYCGATSNNKEEWRYSYGEHPQYVLFGDWQICFQTYADLYNLSPDTMKIARAREVMEYQMSTPQNDYWWWADGLYMVMPVMTKMYHITGNQLYLDKLYEYFKYAQSIMYDEETGLFFRDAKYVYPKHKSNNGSKDFWARGDGWVLAGFAKVLKDLPKIKSGEYSLKSRYYVRVYQPVDNNYTKYRDPLLHTAVYIEDKGTGVKVKEVTQNFPELVEWNKYMDTLRV